MSYNNVINPVYLIHVKPTEKQIYCPTDVHKRLVEEMVLKFIDLESKGKNKKALSDESLKEFNNLKKEFESENIIAIPIEQDNSIPIDIIKVKALTSTYMPVHSDDNNLNNGSFHLYGDVSDKFKVIWFHSRKLTDTQKRYSIGDREFLSNIDSQKKFQHLLIGRSKAILIFDETELIYGLQLHNGNLIGFTEQVDLTVDN
ncbi:hypothetical protein ACTFIW_000766 [Dictyostelium discoideum]